MGVFEMDAFAKGTFAIADTLASMKGKVREERRGEQEREAWSGGGREEEGEMGIIEGDHPR